MSLPASAKYLVIGAGVHGLSTAWHLAKEQRARGEEPDVLIVDKTGVGAGATLGFVHVPQQPVEACIALSIVFVACEIVHAHQGWQGWTERWPWIVAFTFGLLHGFGFAGALNAVGLPQTAIPVALLFFNVGVEIGQLLFIAAILSIMTLARWLSKRAAIPQPAWAWRVAPYSIGGVAAFWMIQRIAAF